jgi:hypothetical protein
METTTIARTTPREKPKPLMFKRQMTSEDFEILAFSAVEALADLEGWAGDLHPSGAIGENHNHYTPSRKFMARLRRNLRDYKFIVLSKREQI